jgi:hypothetical protein
LYNIILRLFRILATLEMGEGVTALQPSKLLGNISHCDIVRCAVEDRPEVINGLNLQEGQQFVSDIFQISGAPFCTSEKILLRFPLFTPALPPSSMIKVKVKYGSKWTDLNGDLRVSKQYLISRRGRDRMVVGYSTTYVISAYHH